MQRRQWSASQPTELPLPGSQRPAIERAPEVHVHHHWHGVSAEDIAAILRRDDGR